MKKIYYALGIMALVAIVLVPTVIFAENENSSSTIRETVRAKVETKAKNIKTNVGIRNNIMETRREISSSTKMEIRGIRAEDRKEMRKALTTKERQNIRSEMRSSVFNAQLNKLISQLNLSLNNLKQIRNRIVARIDKASKENKDMSKAKNLLSIADHKITLAEQAINNLSSLKITTSTSTVTTASTTVNIEKPRQVGNVAIKALNESREALNAVVVAIAHSMGFKPSTRNATTTTD